jgi:hypothetical protein
MTHTSRKKTNVFTNYDETARTQIKTGYEVICFEWVAVTLTCVSMSF